MTDHKKLSPDAAAGGEALPTAPIGRKKKKTLRSLLRPTTLEARKARAGWFFVMPFVLGVVLIYLPILIDSIWFSFADITKGVAGAPDIVTPVGFKYYIQAFNTQYEYKTLLLEGVQQILLEVPAIVVFSLFVAVILNQKMLGRAVFRAIFFVPVILATGLMDSIEAMNQSSDSTEDGVSGGTLEGQEEGLINMMDVELLFSNMKVGTELVVYVVNLVNMIYDIVNFSGVQMLIFLAGLQSISPSIYEACQIEGATAWETFWKITFPMISPMILVNAIYSIIDSFTKESNVVMSYIDDLYNSATPKGQTVAMYWMYFLLILAVIGIFALIAKAFIFYQKRD